MCVVVFCLLFCVRFVCVCVCVCVCLFLCLVLLLLLLLFLFCFLSLPRSMSNWGAVDCPRKLLLDARRLFPTTSRMFFLTPIHFGSPLVADLFWNARLKLPRTPEILAILAKTHRAASVWLPRVFQNVAGSLCAPVLNHLPSTPCGGRHGDCIRLETETNAICCLNLNMIFQSEPVC